DSSLRYPDTPREGERGACEAGERGTARPGEREAGGHGDVLPKRGLHYRRTGRTIVSMRCSSNAAGSSQRPECAGETWIAVLRAETSQWKRSRGESAPIGPAAAP